MKLDRHSLALAVGFSTFVAVTGIVPRLTAERPRTFQFGVRTVPVDSESVEKLDDMLRVPGVSTIAASAVQDSFSLATVVATVEGEDDALRRARLALDRGDLARAEALTNVLVEQLEKEAQDVPVGEESRLNRLSRMRSQALLLQTNIAMQGGDAEKAAELLKTVSPQNPIPDFVAFLRAINLEGAEKHAEAAALFGKVSKMSDTPLEHRAVVRRAHSLFAAKDWKAAEKALGHVIDTYPLYPRRWLALWQRAVALEQLDRAQDAADVYQQTWFEFPYKQVGKDAREKLQALQEDAVVPSNLPTASERYSRYRRLRINKHWDIARDLFTELQQDYATESGHSEFEHEIEFQLALTDYHSRAFESARDRLLALGRAYDAGHRAGISRYLTFKYLSRSYARLGKRKKALEALDRMTEGYGRRSQMRARAEFFEDHGEYAKALKLYDQLYSRYKKRGWHYTWLLYKTGEFEGAYENLTRLAERSRGRRRAKYLYWSARTLERAGKGKEAQEIFVDISESYGISYYGLQARNRLMDLGQRSSVAGQLVASAEGIANSADEVLDALEEAEEEVSEYAFPMDDPRARQRHAFWGSDDGPASWTSGEVCPNTNATDRAFCQLQFEALPSSTASILGATLAAGSGQAALASNAPVDRDALLPDDDERELEELNRGDARVPHEKVEFDDTPPRIEYSSQARIYWDGRLSSAVAFANYRDGETVGPTPDEVTAYDDDAHLGGIGRAARDYGDLFPELVRAHWLHLAGYKQYARWVIRDVAIEFRELSRRWRPRRKPHELDDKRWDYYIDNRRGDRSQLWGLESDELRFPVPKTAAGKKRLLERQQAIHDKREELRPALIQAFKEAGDYYLVRKYTLAQRGWYREDPTGPARKTWMQAYPRAFPELVTEHAYKNGMNPYLLWSLMTVESSYNPDSLSTANALGLLQVIPRTGLKTAIMLGDEDFGPHDLLEADTAIEHGAFYFSKLVRKFRGQELFAIIGYNGGPHRVGDWVEMRGDTMPMDEFVEEVPFNQARGYVKKVLRFLHLYLTLYEGKDELYVGQNIRTDYRPHPKF
jgi:soluble lytic murein transglycosylase-like protein